MNLNEKLMLLMNTTKVSSIARLSLETEIPYTTLISIFNGKVNDIRLSTLKKICDYFNISLDFFSNDDILLNEKNITDNYDNDNVIPILNKVKSNYNYFNSKNIISYININKTVPDLKNYFAYKVIGNSMQPIIYENDIVIVHKQNDIKSGQIGLISINNKEATIKKVIKYKDYIELISFNPYFPSQKLHKNDNFRVIGKIIEARISKLFE